MQNFEPNFNKATCVYCGDAPIPHRIIFYSSLITSLLDNQIMKLNKLAPRFANRMVEYLFHFLFDAMLFFRIAKLSDDITLARTFRSRVIWEEARARGIEMKQLLFFGKPSDEFLAIIAGRKFYFNSLPIPPEKLIMHKNWDDKFLLKEELDKNGIPVPQYKKFSVFSRNLNKIFSSIAKPIIVKPRNGSRGRHTTTNIHTEQEFQNGVEVAKVITPYLVAEEHLEGYVCRATMIEGKIAGFYRGGSPTIVGDGVKTARELIEEKNNSRGERISRVELNEEIEKHVRRVGYGMDDVLPQGVKIKLTHRTGRLFGGATKEMLPELHPSFIPVLEKAAQVVGLAVIGFDCIIPEPTEDAGSQKWGIIECNTLPFIDLHYFALEGKPVNNIAGMVWDLALKNI